MPAIVGDGVAQTAGVVLRLPEKIVAVGQAAFGAGERPVDSPMSVVGVGRVAGDTASTMTFMGVRLAGPGDLAVILLMLLASLNIALFVFNLIPVSYTHLDVYKRQLRCDVVAGVEPERRHEVGEDEQRGGEDAADEERASEHGRKVSSALARGI